MDGDLSSACLEPSPSLMTSLFSHISATPPPLLPVTVASTQAHMLLDTGASVSALSYTFFNARVQSRTIRQVQCPPLSLTVGNGQIVTTRFTVTLPISIASHRWDHTFYLIHHLPHDIIGGLDFFQKTGLIYNAAATTVSFPPKHDPITLVHDNTPSHSSAHRLTVLDQTDLALSDELQRTFPTVLTETLGCTHLLEHTVKLKPDAAPPRPCPTYQVSPALQKIMRQEINKLLNMGVIKPSLSPSVSPCFLVPKKRTHPTEPQMYRLVVDMRDLNSRIDAVDYPIPTIQNLLMHLNGAKVFSLIDFNWSYHQIPVTAASQPLLTFKCPFGTYSYTRIPFGLKVGSQLLSSLMEQIFGDLHGVFLIWYLDDLLIYSETSKDHLSHIREVLTRIQSAGLTINPKKCKFNTRRLEFLGHTIENGLVTISNTRLKALRDIPEPKNLKQLSEFLGGVSFFAAFIPDFAAIAAPLNRLRKKNTPFLWSQECSQAHNTLRQRLLTPPVLRLPDFSNPFHIFTDASQFALGCVLAQHDGTSFHAVTYAGRKLDEREQKYSTYELEFAAVLLAIHKFQQYLGHAHFHLYTDAKAIATLTSMRNVSPRVARWVATLLQFNYTLHHLPGKQNSIADYLSRNCIEPPTTPLDNLYQHGDSSPRDSPVLTILQSYPAVYTKLPTHQYNDPALRPLIDTLRSGATVPKYSLQNGILAYQTASNEYRPILPDNMFDLVFHFCHDSALGSHAGVTRTIDRIKSHFYYPNLHSKVRKQVSSCLTCARSKHAQTTYGNQSSTDPTRPMQLLYLDVAGPLPRTRSQHTHILIVVDGFSRYTYLLPLKKHTTEAILKALQTYVFATVGYCQTVCTDNASTFRSHAFNEFLLLHGIQAHHTPPYYPNPNMAERQIRTLKTILTAFHADDQSQWDTHLPFFQQSINSVRHSSTQYTPARLFLGRELITPLHLIWDIHPAATSDPSSHQAVWRDALANITKARLTRKQYYDRSHAPKTFSIGDVVVIKQYNISSRIQHTNAKLAHKFSRPYQVTGILSPVTYQLTNVDDPVDIKTQHVSQLKPFSPANSTSAPPLPFSVKLPTSPLPFCFSHDHNTSSRDADRDGLCHNPDRPQRGRLPPPHATRQPAAGPRSDSVAELQLARPTPTRPTNQTPLTIPNNHGTPSTLNLPPFSVLPPQHLPPTNPAAQAHQPCPLLAPIIPAATSTSHGPPHPTTPAQNATPGPMAPAADAAQAATPTATTPATYPFPAGGNPAPHLRSSDHYDYPSGQPNSSH